MSSDIVIGKLPGASHWHASTRENDGPRRINSTDYPASMKAGDVARAVALAHPGFQVGISTDCFSPSVREAVLRETGDYVLWMRLGFERSAA